MIPYGTRIAVRRMPRSCVIARCMTSASRKPSTSSTSTVTTVMIRVTRNACQNTGSLSTTT